MFTWPKNDRRQPHDDQKESEGSTSVVVMEREIIDTFESLRGPMLEELKTTAHDMFEQDQKDLGHFEFSITEYVTRKGVNPRRQVSVVRRLAEWLSMNTHSMTCKFDTAKGTFIVKLEIGARIPKLGSLGSVIVRYRFL